MLPNTPDQTITLPINRLLNLILGHGGTASIDPLTAEVLILLDIERKAKWPGEFPLYHIQVEDHDGKCLKEPVLWRWDIWASSVARQERAKKRSERERIERFILAENVNRIAAGIAREWKVEGDAGRMMAWRIAKNLPTGEEFLRQILKVTTAKTEKDL